MMTFQVAATECFYLIPLCNFSVLKSAQTKQKNQTTSRLYSYTVPASAIAPSGRLWPCQRTGSAEVASAFYRWSPWFTSPPPHSSMSRSLCSISACLTQPISPPKESGKRAFPCLFFPLHLGDEWSELWAWWVVGSQIRCIGRVPQSREYVVRRASDCGRRDAPDDVGLNTERDAACTPSAGDVAAHAGARTFRGGSRFCSFAGKQRAICIYWGGKYGGVSIWTIFDGCLAVCVRGGLFAWFLFFCGWCGQQLKGKQRVMWILTTLCFRCLDYK